MFRDSTLTNFNFRSSQRRFLFFLWIEVDFRGGLEFGVRICIQSDWEKLFYIRD